MTRLALADGLSLPVEAATETFLIVGKRGSGKSSTATRFAEQLVRAKVPIAVLDPVDVWWGLKAGAGGERDGGLEVYVFGGEHAELPLEPTAGVLMADTIVEHRINAVFVLRGWSNRERSRFVADFADELFKRNRDVLHLFCEEAHEIMPQSIAFKGQGEEEMLGRMLRLVKLGRTSGIGVTAITQRPASLNKNTTTQAEVLVAHRITGPQDIKAIDGWIEHHHQQDLRKDVLSTLGELKTGEAWFWAPDFPEAQPIGLRRVPVLMPDTFDSRRTPKPGERRREPKSLAPVDLEKLGQKMTATRKRAEENDPAVLKARIRELERQHKEVMPAAKTIEKPVLKDAQIAHLDAVIGHMNTLIEKFYGARDPILIALAKVAPSAASSTETPTPRVRDGGTGNAAMRSLDGAAVRAAAPAANQHRPGTDRAVRRVTVRSGESRAPSSLGKGERRILAAIAQHDGGVTRDQLTVLTGYRRSTRDTYVQRLTLAGLAELNGGGAIVVTPAGIDALGHDYDPLPTGDALREYWLGRLPVGEKAVLEVLVGQYPKVVDRERISELTDYARSSRDTYLQRLSSRKLIVPVGRRQVRAAEALFG